MTQIHVSALIDMHTANNRLSEALTLALEEIEMLQASLKREHATAMDILVEATNAKEFLKHYLIIEILHEAFRKIDWRTCAMNREGL